MDSAPHNPELQAKINTACRTIERALDLYKKPCLFSDFGKESVVLIHMIREWYSKEIVIVQFRHPWFQRKYDFADRLSKEWELTLHTDLPPSGMSLIQGENGAEIVNHYAVGAEYYLQPVRRQSIKSRMKWLCARRDLLVRPTAKAFFPWDMILSPTKACDLVDPSELTLDIRQNTASADMAFPLRHFTDAEIWGMIERWKLPYDKLRYQRQEDGTYAEDFENILHPVPQPYCSDCLDCRKPGAVTCPESGLEVSNISGNFEHVEARQLQYIGA